MYIALPNFNVTINNESAELTTQQMQFSDQNPAWRYEVGSNPDPTYTQADTSDAMLENFFSRPIKIGQFTWSPGVTLFETFNPWTLYFENPRVINRIANFNLLRAKLHVRILINGNGFYYGRAIASYTPLHTLDQMTQDRAYFIEDVVAASQRPHVYIDPTNSQGGDLVLPFFWYQNNLSIPSADWRSMGDMHIHQMQSLKHANGATDPITVSVFAWAEDVHMSIPTQNDPPGLVPQADEDEYGEGPVSRPAAVVAKAAGQLTNIPVIGMYARATELAANAVSGIARLFGYSRPVMTETAIPFSPHLVGNLANTSVPDQSTKLTFDIKQELTVDPRTMGLSDVDEMAIKSIATRESFLTSFPWQIISPVGGLLWNTEVTPVNWTELNSEIHLPACAFAAMPFRYWRGTMKYRFQIVASAFHKGRLQISYDPRLTGIGEFNTQYVYMIDLAKERDFTVEVGWGHEAGALLHGRPGTTPIPHSVFPFPIPLLETRNGILSIRVVNELTSPNSTVDNDVTVNVYVSAGDDFEVFVPEAAILDSYTIFSTDAPANLAAPLQTPLLRNYGEEKTLEAVDEEQGDTTKKSGDEKHFLEPQSNEMPMNQADSDNTKDENQPMKLDPSYSMAPTPSHGDCFTHVYFGDPVTSFRQVLKRYQLCNIIAKDNDADAFVQYTMPDFPPYRGYDPNGINTTSTGDSYNYTKNTLLNYVTSAFTGRRGGLRWKYVRAGAASAVNAGQSFHTVTRLSDSGGFSRSQDGLFLNGSNPNVRERQGIINLPSFWDGSVMNITPNNNVLEVEMPYQISRRFSPSKRTNFAQAIDLFNTFHRYDAVWFTTGGSQDIILRLVSVGEDFTLNFYTGPPVLYYRAPTDEPAAQA